MALLGSPLRVADSVYVASVCIGLSENRTLRYCLFPPARCEHELGILRGEAPRDLEGGFYRDQDAGCFKGWPTQFAAGADRPQAFGNWR